MCLWDVKPYSVNQLYICRSLNCCITRCQVHASSSALTRPRLTNERNNVSRVTRVRSSLSISLHRRLKMFKAAVRRPLYFAAVLSFLFSFTFRHLMSKLAEWPRPKVYYNCRRSFPNLVQFGLLKSENEAGESYKNITVHSVNKR